MKMSAFGLILLFVVMNISFAFMNEVEVLGSMEKPSYQTPDQIVLTLMGMDFTSGDLIWGGAAVGSGVIVNLFLTGSFIYGGTVGLLIFGMSKAFPMVKNILTGFPLFLAMIGVPSAFVTIFEVLQALIWMWFILGFVVSRKLDD